MLVDVHNKYYLINDDSIVGNKIFKFKLELENDYIVTSFSINNLYKVLHIISLMHINYLVVDKCIIDKKNFENNKYNIYVDNRNYK